MVKVLRQIIRERSGKIYAFVAVVATFLVCWGAKTWYIRYREAAVPLSMDDIRRIHDQAAAAEHERNAYQEYPLPQELIVALKQPEQFRTYHSLEGIPVSVATAFAGAAHTSSFAMAEPNGRWEATDVILDPLLPRRRLTSVAVSPEHCLIFYERGGIGRTDNVAAFRTSDNRAIPLWHAYLGHDVQDPAALARAIADKSYREGPFF